MLRPICDDMRVVRAGSHEPPFSHGDRGCPIKTLLVPARTKPFSNTTRRGAREGLCSRPLAQTRHRQGDAILHAFYVDAWCAPCKSINKLHLPGEHRAKSISGTCFLRVKPMVCVIKLEARKCPRGTSLEPARTKPFSNTVRAGALKGLCSRRLCQTRHPQRAPKWGIAPHTILCEPARSNSVSGAKPARETPSKSACFSKRVSVRKGFCSSPLARTRNRPKTGVTTAMSSLCEQAQAKSPSGVCARGA